MRGERKWEVVEGMGDGGVGRCVMDYCGVQVSRDAPQRRRVPRSKLR
jgi:hypothetical protein